MTRILSHPFRLTGSGIAATVDDTSDRGNAEQLAVLLSTRIGERALVQSYGLTDPTFSGVTGPELTAAVAKWGPPVTLNSVDVDFTAPTTQSVTVDFT